MYGINHERISDYGCRKILGIKNPVGRYINTPCNYNKGLKQDTYMSQRQRIKTDEQNEIAKRAKTMLLASTVIAGVGIVIGKIRKNLKLAKAAANLDSAKKGIFAKLKGVFKKK